MNRTFAFALATLWIFLDYVSKQWAVDELFRQSIYVTQWMNLRLAYNPGAAFSFLSGAGGWQRWLFIALAIVVALWLVYALIVEKSNALVRIGYASVLGGALGNLYDRLVHGHVIDFIEWHYRAHYFPTFNLADTAITVGVIALILGTLAMRQKK